MTLTGFLNGKRGTPLYCPLADTRTEETQFAKTTDEPDRRFQGGRVGEFECHVCGGTHRFVVEGTTPLYVGDSSNYPIEAVRRV